MVTFCTSFCIKNTRLVQVLWGFPYRIPFALHHSLQCDCIFVTSFIKHLLRSAWVHPLHDTKSLLHSADVDVNCFIQLPTLLYSFSQAANVYTNENVYETDICSWTKYMFTQLHTTDMHQMFKYETWQSNK